jgi:hypothetical protein
LSTLSTGVRRFAGRNRQDDNRHREWAQEIEINKPYPGDINTWEDYIKLAAAAP